MNLPNLLHSSRNLEDAVEYYQSCCKKYKRTPLQVELLKELVEANHEKLLTSALNATATVYGAMKAKMSLAVAFAEKRKTETLTKLLLVCIMNYCMYYKHLGILESTAFMLIGLLCPLGAIYSDKLQHIVDEGLFPHVKF